MEKLILKIPFADGLTPELYKKLQPVLDKIKQHALERCRLNAPIHDGFFRDSLWVEPTMEVDYIVFDFGSSAPRGQLLKLHEDEYKLGPISEIQPVTPEGGIGKKFFTRVIEFWGPTWADWLADAMLEIIETDLITSWENT